MIQINPAPAFFSKIGNTFGDDFVIESTYPGGHDALVDTIITSKMRLDRVKNEFDKNANSYHDAIAEYKVQVYSSWIDMSKSFDFGGTVLDLGCGTGCIGRILQKSHNAQLTGVDISVEMAKQATTYDKVYVDLLENVILDLNSTFDHIVSCGAFMYCCKPTFELVLSKMFTVATQSITFCVEDLNDKYILTISKNFNCSVYNHLDTIRNFHIPSKWIEVHNKYQIFWKSPRTGTDVSGIVLRYERVDN